MKTLLQTLDTPRVAMKDAPRTSSRKNADNADTTNFKQSLSSATKESRPSESTANKAEAESNTRDAIETVEKPQHESQTQNTDKTQNSESNTDQETNETTEPVEISEDSEVKQEVNADAIADVMTIQIDAQYIQPEQQQDGQSKVPTIQDLQNIVEEVFNTSDVEIKIENEVDVNKQSPVAQQLQQEQTIEVADQIQVVTENTTQTSEQTTTQTVVSESQSKQATQALEQSQTEQADVVTNTQEQSQKQSEVGPLDQKQAKTTQTQKSESESIIAADGFKHESKKQDIKQSDRPEAASLRDPAMRDAAPMRVDDHTNGAIKINTMNTTPERATQQVQLPTTGTDNEQLNMARVARGLQSAIHQNGGNLTLRLTPESMGTVRIQLQITGAQVNVQLHTEHESARSMLNQHISNLRQSLEHQGLSVERIGVQSMQNSSQSNTNSQSDMSQSDGRSRGEYSGQQGQNNQDNQQDRQKQNNSFTDLFAEESAA
ncbi:Flagellar hook-length control protein FliK [Poriferisphaera corsica]|uniref:Flagellar hook-length control protein FliK n=1 Tax=Poriferisphaera corsica TaxID=2528020 RepID=A0A517YSI0_9BACT|nr:flagellar hook-length control protein FliK [Poriferisphaera corsica]QDU33171.1 Flagellar hook-length control protein FliK [Poriferisphaera corsica]